MFKYLFKNKTVSYVKYMKNVFQTAFKPAFQIKRGESLGARIKRACTTKEIAEFT